MNHCEPSFLKHYVFMSLIIGFWPTNWKDMGILKRYHNITLVCLWEWYKIEKYGINSANFFHTNKNKKHWNSFLSKNKNIQKSIDISKNQRAFEAQSIFIGSYKKECINTRLNIV